MLYPSLRQLTSIITPQNSKASKAPQSALQVQWAKLKSRRDDPIIAQGKRGTSAALGKCTPKYSPSPREARAGRGLGRGARFRSYDVLWVAPCLCSPSSRKRESFVSDGSGIKMGPAPKVPRIIVWILLDNRKTSTILTSITRRATHKNIPSRSLAHVPPCTLLSIRRAGQLMGNDLLFGERYFDPPVHLQWQ